LIPSKEIFHSTFVPGLIRNFIFSQKGQILGLSITKPQFFAFSKEKLKNTQVPGPKYDAFR
jgi:hypothetical protein